MVVAMALFAAVTTPLAGVLTASISSHRGAQERTFAEQAAAQQLEAVRALPYDSVGLVNGNPPGAVVASRTVVSGAMRATLTTTVAFVSDPTRTGYVTGADYKRVVVTVRRARDGKRLTQASTYVAPTSRGAYGGLNGTIIRAQVFDYALNTPIVGAAVGVSGGPSPARNDVTDASGTVTFAGLIANPTSGAQAYYDISAGATGYTVLADDLPPAAAAHTQLAPGQTFNTAIRVYRPATLTVRLSDSTGAAYTGAATVTVGSSRASQSFAAGGGQVTVSSLGGEPLVPGLSYTVSAFSSTGRWAPAVARAVPDAYPTVLTSTIALTLGATAPTTGALTLRVQTPGGTVISGARVALSGGPSSTYLTAVSDASGNARFTVPRGSGYSASATRADRTGSGTWTGTVNATSSGTVSVS
jgi:hypothetical protein